MAADKNTIQRESRPAPKPKVGAKQQSSEEDIDLEALAEKVFELLKQEARVERERRGR